VPSEVFVDLRGWLADDLEAVRTRFEVAVASQVPETRWRERADGGGSSLAALLLHVTIHQDLAVHTALGGRPPRFAAEAASLGLTRDASPLASLQEAEDVDVTSALDLPALRRYAADVHRDARAMLARLDVDELGTVPDSSGRLADVAGVSAEDAPWLHAMWSGKPAAWFVRWEVIGHAQGHVGEMVSVRDRLGYRPF
jgi:hypothetical protein